MKKQIENLRAELEKIGIRTDQDLRDAINKLPPLKLYIMTGDIGEFQKRTEDELGQKYDLCG